MKLSNSVWLLAIALAAVAMVATGSNSTFQGTHPMPTGGGGHLLAQGTHPMPTGGGGHLLAQGTHPMPTGGGGHLA
jgi:hypothetical protein